MNHRHKQHTTPQEPCQGPYLGVLEIPPPARAHPEKVERICRDLYPVLLSLGLRMKAEKFRSCGYRYVRWQCSDCHTIRDFPLSCDLRLCPKCASRRANRIVARHYQAISGVKRPKMLTLTWLSSRKLTRQVITRTTKDFRRLRQRKLFKNAVSGGLSCIEFTYGKYGWHPHIHAFLDGFFMPQALLATTWQRVTGDSRVVDIRTVETTKGVREVVKYPFKITDFYRDPELVAQHMDASHGRRFVTAFGSFYHSGRGDPPAPKPPKPKNIFDKTNLIPPGSPRLYECPICQGNDIQCLGSILDPAFDPRPHQSFLPRPVPEP